MSKIHCQWKICQFPSLHKRSCPGFSVSFRWKLRVSSVVLLPYYCVILLQKQRAVVVFNTKSSMQAVSRQDCVSEPTCDLISS